MLCNTGQTPNRQLFFWSALGALALLTLLALPARGQPLHHGYDQADSVVAPARMNEAPPLKPRRVGHSPRPHFVSIAPVSAERQLAETGVAQPPGTPRKIGFGRAVPQLSSPADTAGRLQWQTTSQGGEIAAISISSQQATGIRLGILVFRMPAEATLRFYAQGAGAGYEVSGQEILDVLKRNLEAGDRSDEGSTYWAPYIEGGEATLEIELPPGIGPETVEISIPRISHFFSSPLAAQGTNLIKRIGAAASCENDVSCYSEWNPESNATAKMIYVDSGSSYICTGTLVTDTVASGTPYFLSANHCISTQTSASTLQTYWFYRSSACNSGILNPDSVTSTGGASLLYASPNTDTAFMKLASAPPAGAIFSGWQASPPSLGALVTGIHNPRGDLQKISFGALKKYQSCTGAIGGSFTCSDASQNNSGFLQLAWTNGITEPGSSGSGLFASNGSSLYLIGQLYGGTTACGDPNGTDNYGRFDVAYNAALHQWLKAGTLSVTTSGNGSGTVRSTPSGINCGTTCSAPFTGGTNVTLTATAAPGSFFSGWSGACTGAGTSCSVLINADSSVTATYLIAIAPSAPTNVTAFAGNGSATVAFTPGAMGNGTLVNYQVGCGIDSAHLSYGTGGNSLITVPGLANGTVNYCWAQAITTAGYSAWSTISNSVIPRSTPTASVPVVEFYNSDLDNYFITADANEAAAIDRGSAGAGWSRTGNTFKSGGNTSVCRFYGSQSPGPNSHFYTVDAGECASLMQLQAITPNTQKRWNFESLDFSSTPPTNGACPSGTVPVYRAYNKGSTRNVDSNHRIAATLAAIREVVNRGWAAEGVVMCAPQ